MHGNTYLIKKTQDGATTTIAEIVLDQFGLPFRCYCRTILVQTVCTCQVLSVTRGIFDQILRRLGPEFLRRDGRTATAEPVKLAIQHGCFSLNGEAPDEKFNGRNDGSRATGIEWEGQVNQVPDSDTYKAQWDDAPVEDVHRETTCNVGWRESVEQLLQEETDRVVLTSNYQLCLQTRNVLHCPGIVGLHAFYVS